MHTPRRATVLVATALASGIVTGSAVVSGAQTSSNEPRTWRADNSGNEYPTAPVPPAPPAKGAKLKIGPWRANETAPDLVPVDLDNGKSGFLRTYDLAFGNKNPSFVRTISDSSSEMVLPVYQEDGQTVIGEFVAGTTTVE